MKFQLMKFLHTLQEEAGDGTGGGASGGTDGSGDSGSDGGSELLAGKYENQDALIAGYTELQTAFSAKDETHKEELAKFNSPEEFTAGEGWKEDNAMNNRMMAVFQAVAGEHGMSQGMYEGLVNGMTEMQDRVATDGMTETIKSIPNYETRASNMQDMALKHLRPDQAQAMDTLMTSKESFEAVEVLLNNLRGGTLPSNVQQQTEMNEVELRSKIKNLNPADTQERGRLMKMLNDQGNGEGKLI